MESDDYQDGRCPVCDSAFTAFVRAVPTIRSKRDIPLFTCLECQSFWNPSGYIEDERVLKLDMEWGLSVSDRNESAATQLLDTFGELGVRPNSLAEIGCGIGTFLRVSQEKGIDSIGFDVNPFAIAYARENGLDAHAVFWSAETELSKIDLFLSVSVLEHIECPRELISEMCKAAVNNNAYLFISVPFLERDKWRFILNPDPLLPDTPFFDNDVHVTHFTKSGLSSALHDFGLGQQVFIDTGLWHGFLASA